MALKKTRILAGIAISTAAVAASVAFAQQQPQAQPQPPGVANTVTASQRPIAYIFGNIPITREDLGEYLIARGGHEKVELLINKKIIEKACVEKGITVTPQEVEAALSDDLKGLTITKEEFLKHMLPRYGMTYYEWMEDKIKPALQLGKLCKDRVKVSEEDLQKQFEHEYGEKRQIQIVMWPKSDPLNTIQAAYATMRVNQDGFDRVARAQANPSLGASAGHIAPIRKHSTGEDKVVEITAFKLQEGELSSIIELANGQGYMVMKMHKIIPADATKTMANTRDDLYRQAFQKNLEKEIPKYFADLRAAANVTVLLKGPPAEWQVRLGAKAIADDVSKGTGGLQTVGGTEKK